MTKVDFSQLATELADCPGSIATLRLVERLYPKLIRYNDRGIIEKSCSIDRLVEEINTAKRD